MNRRKLLLSALSAPMLASAQSVPGPSRQFFELRWFYLRNGNHAPRMMDLLKNHWVAAANGTGIKPVGLFQPTFGDQAPSVLMISQFSSATEAADGFDRMMRNAEFAAAYAQANLPEPAFVRMDVTLLRAFETTPSLVLPSELPNNASHIFELRTYESNSMVSLRKKLEMFNSGEAAIFKRLGLAPVFFGEGVFGRNLPSLTYMLSFANMAEHDRLWSAFVADAEFTKLRTQPGYSDADIVSTISNSILHPLGFSQIR
ncbi:NIPSNAP family protein [Nevskia soli]|jgi:hypothetical protein|uniref:NIPSNAP family protein n=1 Tax=Nevskia soli TaxID=418856 RepID=UPI0015D75C43|nr:NIPSNAP family protein [Nevskia soli]